MNSLSIFVPCCIIVLSHMDLSAYKTSFLTAAREHLSNFSANLNILSQNTNDLELITETHRIIHSLGSQCFAMGYKKTGEYAREIEHYFYRLKGKGTFEVDSMPVLNDAAEKIKESLDNIETSDAENDLDQELESVKSKLS